MQFVTALLAMLGAFTIAWAWLMIRRYQLAAAEARAEEALRRRQVAEARGAALPAGRIEEATR
jgi:hypothetical protein